MMRRFLFAAFLVLFAFALQFSAPDRLASIDGYFHIRYCELLREAGWRGFPPDFPWLPLTVLAPDRYFDHHWLYHVLIAPLASGNLVLRAKLIAAAGAALVFLACYGFLLWQRVSAAEWWTVALLAAAPGFLYRMEMPRVQAWSLLCLLAALALLIRRRHAWLLPLAWFYTWLYDAFPLLFGVCGCAVAATAAVERRIETRPLVFATAGVLIGLLANPYFPHDFAFIAHHYLAKVAGGPVPVGSEWYPLPVAEWFGSAGLAAIVTAVLVPVFRQRAALGTTGVTLALTGLLFFALLWRASRFVEYCVPFAGIALAATLHAPVSSWIGRRSSRTRRAAAALLLLWLAASSAVAAWKIHGRPPPHRYAGAAAWLAANSAPGSLVFNVDWDDFPLLFFHNTQNRYVIGLDPTYLARHDPGAYEAWAAIASGAEPQPAALLRDRFGAPFAITDRQHEGFIRAMDATPLARRAYEDNDAIVYAVRLGSR